MCVQLKIAARDSKLSQAQIKEVMEPLGLPYTALLVKSHGDLDHTQSLRLLDKTDFFTREVDALVQSGACDIALHSAKDLPRELPEGLKIVALTAGLDNRDSLVIREDETLADVKLVATSSKKREVAASQLKSDLRFCDIRGTIHERLEKLYNHEVDGVVIAEAALLRLKLNPNRLFLPGATTPLQGQLAIVARHEAKFDFLEALDVRPKDTLYLGLRCPNPLWHHFPILVIEERSFTPVQEATHYIFTSRTAAQLYRQHLTQKPLFCTGKATAEELKGFDVIVAEDEQAEGVIKLLEKADLKAAHVVWPRSAEARPVISKWLKVNNIKFTEINLYDIKTTALTPPDITFFKNVIFTSPTTVKAFKELYGYLPEDKELHAIGPITALELTRK